MSYIVIELPDGLLPVELKADQLPEEVADAEGGILIDEGPFATIEEANDAIDNIKAEEDEPQA